MVEHLSNLDNYLKLNSEQLIESDIAYLKTIFILFSKEKEFEQVLKNCYFYLYRLGTRQEVNDSSYQKDFLRKALEIGWINITLRYNIIFLLKIEEKN